MNHWSDFRRRYLATDIDRPAIQVEHTVLPVDVGAIDLRIAEIAAVPPAKRTPGQWAAMDRLLDRRLNAQSAPGEVPPLGIRTAAPGGAS
jgi:hypothetical protein